MKGDDPKITRLKHDVMAIEQEIGLAIMFHETWKPTAYDEGLHRRMGESYATQSLMVVRMALRREMLMALIRLWDPDYRTIAIPAVVNTLRDDEFFVGFCAYRARRLGSHGINLTPEVDLSTLRDSALKESLSQRRSELFDLYNRYEKGGSQHGVIRHLMTLRSVSLAHRQKEPKTANRADSTDEEIESFYQDNLEMVRLLLHLVMARAFDLTEAADVYGTYAGYFWSAARGERTEGHPAYRPPHRPSGI
ncbi:hypothetical protein [Paraburkholderia sp. SIMBA_054]|uniref:AbiU2 domain-containing protein n=1 Tax=Paraburkholderia sp. SIMBA_054 TaxID=3085795 RepID=UPI00397A31D0